MRATSMSPGARRALIALHIALSVALLGDSAGFLAVAIRASSASEPGFAETSYELLDMFSLVFGIPLSLAALITGIALVRTSRWEVLKYLWIAAKLGVIVSVMLVGALVIGPGIDAAQAGEEADVRLIVAAAYDVVALGTAVGLAVYKPGRVGRPRRHGSRERGRHDLNQVVR